MENKEVLKFINDNYKRAYQDHLKGVKRKKKRMLIHNIIDSILLFIILGLLIYSVNYETRKAVDGCLKNGYSYNFCIREGAK